MHGQWIHIQITCRTVYHEVSFGTAVHRNQLKVALTRPHRISVARYLSFVKCTSVSAGYSVSNSVHKHLVRFPANGVSGIEVEFCVEAENAPSRRAINLNKVVNVVSILSISFLVQFRLGKKEFMLWCRAVQICMHTIIIYVHVCACALLPKEASIEKTEHCKQLRHHPHVHIARQLLQPC